jgi:rare lipoprotein A
MKILRWGSVLVFLFTGACESAHTPTPVTTPVPPQAALPPPEPPLPAVVERGKASYYAQSFDGRTTASGTAMNQDALTAASKDLPLGTTAVVTNLKTGKSVEVTVNDRGPFIPGRVVDLSQRAADALGMQGSGVVPVKVEAKPQDQPTPALKEKVVHTAIAKEKAKERRMARQRKAASAHKPQPGGGGGEQVTRTPSPQKTAAEKSGPE